MTPNRTMVGPLRGRLARYARVQWALGAAALAALVAFHVFAHRPSARRVDRVDGEIAALRAELALDAPAGAQPPEAAHGADGVAALRQRLKNSRKLSGAYGPEQFVREVAETCQNAGLRKLAVQSGAVRRSGPVVEVPVMLRFEGDFLDVCSFLRQTEQSPWLTRVKGLQVRTTDAQAGQVEVELSLKAYSAEE